MEEAEGALCPSSSPRWKEQNQNESEKEIKINIPKSNSKNPIMDTEVTWRKTQSEVTALLPHPRWADLTPKAQRHLPTFQQQFCTDSGCRDLGGWREGPRDVCEVRSRLSHPQSRAARPHAVSIMPQIAA